LERRRLNHGKWLRSLELQDVESGVVVGELDHALHIDKAVCGLDDLRLVGTRVEHALWIMPLGAPLAERWNNWTGSRRR
jgi:hypothetical protein